MISNQKLRRIIFVTNNYKPYAGGVVSSINSCVAELRKHGHEVFIVTLTFLHDHVDDDPWIIRIPCPIKFLYKKNRMAIPWRSRFHLKRIINDLKPDIIHVHHPFLLGQASLKIARECLIPIVFTYHTMYEYYLHYVPLPNWLTKPIVKQMALSFCNSVDGIIAPSNAIKEYLDSYSVKKPIKVIPSSLQSIFFPKKGVIKKRSLYDPFHILIVSRFTKEKNIFFLLDVFSRLDQGCFDLTLVGFGAEYEGLQKYAYEILKLSRKKVRFIHKPERHVIAQCYCDADLFLFSSKHDTQGLVLAEAMSGGTPVIALDGPGQRDIIVNGVNGFIAKDSIAMIEKINLLKNDSLLHMRMKKMAQNVSFRYMPEPLTKRLLDFYEMLRNKVTNDS